MANICLVGCGDLGSAIAAQLSTAGHQITGVRKSAKVLPNISTIQADVTDYASLKPLVDLTPEIIIYCISATAQTDENYHAHYVLGLQNVLKTQQKNTLLKHVFFVSSTRVYGQLSDEVLDENTPAEPKDFGGFRLIEAEQQLETLSCGYTALRLSGIYGEGRYYLVNMAKNPSAWSAQNSWTNRIHQTDAAAFIAFLVNKITISQPVNNCYIVTDCAPVSQHEVLKWLSSQMQITFPDMNISIPTSGKRLSNRQMLVTGYPMQYPDYKIGYDAVLKSMKHET
jgi:nucleoside-diphosphate-sugar epimerase